MATLSGRLGHNRYSERAGLGLLGPRPVSTEASGLGRSEVAQGWGPVRPAAPAAAGLAPASASTWSSPRRHQLIARAEGLPALADKPKSGSEPQKLPRVERTISGDPEYFPLIETVQTTKAYQDIGGSANSVAARILGVCSKQDTFTVLQPKDLEELDITPPEVALSSPARLGRDMKLAEVVAALFLETGVEWSVTIASDANRRPFYTFVRGELNQVLAVDEIKGSALWSIGAISHNHPGGSAVPSFGDLQSISIERQRAKELGFETSEDDILVVNKDRYTREAFDLVRYEYTFDLPWKTKP